MYEQTYKPNVNVHATPALCLQYVDDAIKSLKRSGTAKAAYETEKKAGRFNTGQLPDKVWVIVWFSFSKGSYTYPSGSTVYYKDAWHIALARRNGKTVEIHDSEVHSGARSPYRALAEVEAWFAAYGTKYVGWSGSCDGRTIAKKGQEMIDEVSLSCMYRLYLGTGITAYGRKHRLGKQTPAQVQKDMIASKEYKAIIAQAKKGLVPVNNLPIALRKELGQ